MSGDGRRTLRVLCVDDDADIRLLVELSLHLDPDIRAWSLGSVDEAIAALAGDQRFDVVLLDAMMPGRDGLELLNHITRADGSPPLPVIFLTADAIRRSRYDLPGVVGVISKPFDPIALAEQVRTLLTR